MSKAFDYTPQDNDREKNRIDDLGEVPTFKEVLVEYEDSDYLVQPILDGETYHVLGKVSGDLNDDTIRLEGVEPELANEIESALDDQEEHYIQRELS